MRGLVESRHRGRSVPVDSHLAAVYQPLGETVFTRWPTRCCVLAVKIDSAAVERLLDGVGGRSGFSPAIDLSAGTGESLARLLREASRQLRGADSLLRNPLVAAPFAESVVTGFLLAAHPGYAAARSAPQELEPVGVVRKAVDLVEADPAHPWTTQTLAERCFVRARTLQNAFRRQLAITAMDFVRSVRLREAHRELRRTDPSMTTVASIAHRWGFTHLGRFAAAHRKAYGEFPGEMSRLLDLHTA
jgi:AraC-like DNA-binding protein